ncbi:MAG: DUF2975 domain-containing protein [Actinomadura sp.]
MRTAFWSRVDERLLEALLGAALALVALFGLLLPLFGVLGAGEPAARTVAINRPAIAPGVPAGGDATLTGTREAELTVPHPDLIQRILLDAPGIVISAMTLLVIYLLIRIARTLQAGEPFVPPNARRIRMIAAIVLLAGVLGPVAEATTTQLLVQGNPVADVVDFEAHIPGLPVLVGLLIAALAEVFARGTRLRQDTEGLV